VAIIIGGAGVNGLGFAAAHMMAEHGARVAIFDLASANPSAAASELGPEHIGIVADVTNKEQCDAAAKSVLARYGRIDDLPGFRRHVVAPIDSPLQQ
jgi:NAD(P)-dependent dehydrogenase (short-subunit alcohol dehydrogenase family)